MVIISNRTTQIRRVYRTLFRLGAEGAGPLFASLFYHQHRVTKSQEVSKTLQENLTAKVIGYLVRDLSQRPNLRPGYSLFFRANLLRCIDYTVTHKLHVVKCALPNWRSHIFISPSCGLPPHLSGSRMTLSFLCHLM